MHTNALKPVNYIRNFQYKPYVTIFNCASTTVFILLVRKANAKGSVIGFEIAPPSKGGGSDKHLAVN